MLTKKRNLTPSDARARVDDARDGSLADASDKYLYELRRQVRCWEASIQFKIDARERLKGEFDGT